MSGVDKARFVESCVNWIMSVQQNTVVEKEYVNWLCERVITESLLLRIFFLLM